MQCLNTGKRRLGLSSCSLFEVNLVMFDAEQRNGANRRNDTAPQSLAKGYEDLSI